MTDEQMIATKQYLTIIMQKVNTCGDYLTNILNKKGTAPDAYTQIQCCCALFLLEDITNSLRIAVDAVTLSQINSEISGLSDTEES